jgi:hypothetical protein
MILEEFLKQQIDELNLLIAPELKKAVELKGYAMFLAFIGGGYGAMETYPKLIKFKFTTLEIYLVMFSIILVVVYAAYKIPTYKLFTQIRHDHVRNRLKQRIINFLNSETINDYEYSPNRMIDEKHVSNIGLFQRVSDFRYGDDLLVSRSGLHLIQISEMHILALFRSFFNGFLILINYADKISPNRDFLLIPESQKTKLKLSVLSHNLFLSNAYYFNYNDDFTNRILSLFEKYKISGFVKTKNNLLYIGIYGNKNMLEYDFGKNADNYGKILSDALLLKKCMLFTTDLLQEN